MSLSRNEEGMTLIELMVAAALSILVLGGILAALFVADRTQLFGSRESKAVDDATLALRQLELHVRNARAVSNCDPVNGTCVAVQVQTPAGADVTYRYVLDGTRLVRQREDAAATPPTFETDRVLAQDIVNNAGTETLFNCTSNGELLEVTILVQLHPSGNEVFRRQTSLRPRNGTIANCP
jgi:type II secretory pathway pseudopilin PulG